LCWLLSSFLLTLFYTSMILAHLLASDKTNIKTYDDLANAQVIPTTAVNTSLVIMLKVNIINCFNYYFQHDAFIFSKEGKSEAINRVYSKMVKHGLQNCLLPRSIMFSEKIINEILSGKRAMFFSLNAMKSILTNRVTKKKQCGFYLVTTVDSYTPLFMLYNKNFSKRLKGEIDSMYLNYISS